VFVGGFGAAKASVGSKRNNRIFIEMALQPTEEITIKAIFLS
jgi:hypothetical protein